MKVSDYWDVFHYLALQFLWYQLAGNLRHLGINPYKIRTLERMRWDNRILPRMPWHCFVCGKITFFNLRHKKHSQLFGSHIHFKYTKRLWFSCRSCVKQGKINAKAYAS